ncbi:unnamed protein product [Adineta ricciae]|uniref:Uncharacterized protein n=1 Tax=Adineta ricciae TaxID=249248 RepID=A0A813ZI94_ADIRI|nr:unnamed protein product [Adineta ricciae]CAF1152250.1 unnamed protein product [Adineta ricciae]
MRVFRRRKKFGNFGGPARDAEPLPDIVYQMGAEQAARLVALQARGQSPDLSRHGRYAPYIVDEDPYGGGEDASEQRSSSPFNFIANALGISRSRSRRRVPDGQAENFARPGSPAHFAHSLPGTPVQYRRRAMSPELVRSRPSSPFQFAQPERVPSPLHFAHHSRPASPVITRRLQRAQFSQQLQQAEREQREQEEMMMMMNNNYSGQFMAQYPQMQQPYYPLINSMAHQPQMYTFY